MKEKKVVKNNLAEAKAIRQRSRTSCVQLQNFLFYQQNALQKRSILAPCNMFVKPKSQTKKQFRRAFKTLTKQQQSEYFLLNVRNVEKFLILNPKGVGEQGRSIQQYQSNSIKVHFQIKDERIYRSFTEVDAEIIRKQNIIRIKNSKQQIDLHYYLIRKSKGKMHCIILQSTQAYNPSDTIRILFSQDDFENGYNIVRKTWENAQYNNIKKLLLEGNRFPRKIQAHRILSKSMTQLNGQQDYKHKDVQHLKLSVNSNLMNSKKLLMKENKQGNLNLQKNKDYILNELKLSLNSYESFIQYENGVYFGKDGRKVRKIFKLRQSQSNMKSVCCIIDDLKCMKNRKNIQQIKQISNIPSEKTTIYKELDLLNNRRVQFVYLRHLMKKQDQVYYYQKSIELEQVKQKKECIKGVINYCIWRIKNNNQYIEIVVEADIEYSKNIQNQQLITSDYIGQIKLVSQNYDEQQIQLDQLDTQQFENYYLQQISEPPNDQEFFTVNGSFSVFQQQVLDQQAQYNHQGVSRNFNKKKSDNFQRLLSSQSQTNKDTASSLTQHDFLKHKFQVVPKTKGKAIQMRQDKGHTVLGDEWKIDNEGYLVNTNYQKIKMQSSVLKLVLKRMGRNILSGKSILNVSLPIQIFARQSNLQRIARGYSYAPIFLQKAECAKSPLQRAKNVFCFALGYSISYIMMEKPFNPVLGETYQGQIDGCPVYGQQISHHPPISYMLFIGRGYKVYGSFESKVQMGMNSASGINDGFNHIEFTNSKTTVKINGAPGQMHGVIIGQRKLAFTKKSYYIDEDNRIFCEFSWGKQPSNSRKQSKYQDFVSGKMVKLKNGVNINDYKKIKPKDIQIQYGQIYGRCTDRIYFQDQLIFDVIQTAPLLIEYYSPCLQSDSRTRKDIILRKENNFPLAGDAKQQIQQIQRNDRKLRKNK